MWLSHLVLAGFLASVNASCLHGTSLLRRRSYLEGRQAKVVPVKDFGYTNLQGPLNWAGLKAENSACREGSNQSPINIDDSVGVAQAPPQINIANVQAAEFENLGTTVEAIVNGTTRIAGKDFQLKQMHMHTPSEHRINEEYFPLEIHMVHEAVGNPNDIAVMAVLFQMSQDSTTELLRSMTRNIAAIRTPGTVTETGPLDFAPLVQHLSTTQLRQYTGSLTTPPCAEGLTFLVTAQPLPIDVVTYNNIKSVVRFNSRFTQNRLGNPNLLRVAGGNEATANAGGSAVAEAGQGAANPASAPVPELPKPRGQIVPAPRPA